MFSSIIDTWPPEPGPDQTTTGELMYTCELDGHESVNMTGLEAGAWWTGLRLSVPLEASITAIQFEVSLIVDDGTVLDSWYQDSGATHYLTWPMPALMAKHSGLFLRIRPTQTAYGPFTVAIHVYFHELPDINQSLRFIFLRNQRPVLYWNGQQEQWGAPHTSQPPSFGLDHVVVPTMADLLSGGELPYPATWFLTAWDNAVSLDPAAE